MIKVADFIINTLAERGIDKMFVVYGAANGDLIDAFTRTAATQYVAVMHEQAGGFAAEAYAKVKGIPGVAIATSGPGGMNLLTGPTAQDDHHGVVVGEQCSRLRRRAHALSSVRGLKASTVASGGSGYGSLRRQGQLP